MTRRVGVIAGAGRLPHLLVDALTSAHHSISVVALKGEVDSSFAQKVEHELVAVGQLSKMREIFLREQVKEVVMVGAVSHLRAMKEGIPDKGALAVLKKLRQLTDDGILRAVAAYFEEAGIRITSAATFLPDIILKPGHWAGPQLSRTQKSDVELGFKVARLIGQADVGQTVVVKDGHVLAVEAIEGTDEAIRRGAKLGGEGCVVVKCAKPKQDERFDLPSIGPTTVELLRQMRARVLAVEADKTIAIDVAVVSEWCTRFRISLVAQV